MVYENVGDLWQHLLSGIDLSELTEKIISVVITIIVFLFSSRSAMGWSINFLMKIRKISHSRSEKEYLPLKRL